MNKQRVLLSWSSGKDSAWTLHVLRQAANIEVVGLLTTFNEAFDRVAMHAVRHELVRAQARAAGLPLKAVPLPWPCSNADYERIMTKALAEIRQEFKPSHIAFGDLFLEDIRDYRLRQMAGSGIELLFPLWQLETLQLARDMQAGGLRAIVSCVDPAQLDKSFCGRNFDQQFLADLPPAVDPCGENGEFHSFVHAGPMFNSEIAVTSGDTVERDNFVFTDIHFSTAAGQH